MAEWLTDVLYGKRWRIWKYDATRSGVSGPETLPPDGAPQRGLRATEENPVEVMAVEEAEAMLQRAGTRLEEQDAEIASLQQECREAQASENAAIKRAKKAEEQRDRLLAAIKEHERPFGDFPVLPELNSRDEALYRTAREVLRSEPLRIAREVQGDGQ